MKCSCVTTWSVGEVARDRSTSSVFCQHQYFHIILLRYDIHDMDCNVDQTPSDAAWEELYFLFEGQNDF